MLEKPKIQVTRYPADSQGCVDAFHQQIGLFLWSLIKERGITQNKLAPKLHVSRRRLRAMLENPSLSTVARICAALDVVPEVRVKLKLPDEIETSRTEWPTPPVDKPDESG